LLKKFPTVRFVPFSIPPLGGASTTPDEPDTSIADGAFVERGFQLMAATFASFSRRPSPNSFSARIGFETKLGMNQKRNPSN
jgi:hypothetical protein